MPDFNNTKVTDLNWLASEKFTSFTEYADHSMLSGEVFRKNGKAVGLVLDDVKVQDADHQRPVAVVYGGFVNEKLLPATVSDVDKQAMTALHFK